MTVGGRLVVAALRSACYRRLASGFWAWQRATASANEDEATAAARLDGASEARTLFEVRTRFPPQSPAKRYSGAPARTPTTHPLSNDLTALTAHVRTPHP
jgi:hypothetical protein